MAELTEQEKDAIATIAQAVLEHDDLIDEMAEITGADDIATDPTEVALQLVHAAVLDPNKFDATLKHYDATMNFGVGAALAAAGSIVGGLFKKGQGGEATGIFKGVFSGIKDKIGNWKDRRQVKKALKASGDPNWRQKWREMKPALKAAQAGGGSIAGAAGSLGMPGASGSDTSDVDITQEPTGGKTLGQFGQETGTGIPKGSENIQIPPGMTEGDIKAGIAELQKRKKQIKIFQIVSGVLGAGLIGTLIWAFTK